MSDDNTRIDGFPSDTPPPLPPRPNTMLRSLAGDDDLLIAAYGEQQTGHLVLGLEGLFHKLSDVTKLVEDERVTIDEAAQFIRALRLEIHNMNAELERRIGEDMAADYEGDD